MKAHLIGSVERELDRVDRLMIAIPKARLGTINWFLLIYVLLSLLINLVVFRFSWLGPLARATGGIIQPTLVVNVFIIVVCVYGVLHVSGGIWIKGITGGANAAKQAIFYTFVLWIMAQLVSFTWSALVGEISLNPIWSQGGPAIVLGALIAQLAGNAMFEEIAFRGLLLPQVYLRLSYRMHRWLRVLLAVILSQVVFALIHIPNRIYIGLPLAGYTMELFRLLGLGAIFAVIFLRTGNLFFAVGVHALLNQPASLFSYPSSGPLLLALTAIILTVWPRNRGSDPVLHNR